MTARNSAVNARSTTRVSAEPVRKLRMFSSSRTRATQSPARQLGEASAPGKDDEVAVPRCFKLAAPHDYGLAVDWILHKHAAVGDLGQYEEPPVAAAGNRRQRRLG